MIEPTFFNLCVGVLQPLRFVKQQASKGGFGVQMKLADQGERQGANVKGSQAGRAFSNRGP
jgi:hypothetical protein